MSMFPRKELSIGGNSYALFILESGGIDIIKIKARRGRSFYCKYGYYEPNEEYRYICGNSDVYVFDQNSATPIRIGALIDIQRYLVMSNRAQLMGQEINYLLGRSEISDDFEDAEQAQKMRDHVQGLANGIGPTAAKFIYEYFDEDVIARHDIMYEAAHKLRFRVAKSHSIIPFIPQDTLGKRNIAIVVVNDTMLDFVLVDPQVDPHKRIRYFDAGKYGRFYIRENRTRYRFKKTNVFVVAVTTDVPETVLPVQTPILPAEPVKEEPAPVAKRGRGKKVKEEKKPEPEPEVKEEKKKLFNFSKDKPAEVLDPYTYSPVTLPVYAGDEEKKNGEEAVIVPKYEDEAQTIAVNAAKFLPKVHYNDPVLLKNAFENVKHQKIAIDLTSKPLVRQSMDPKVIMAIGMVVMMFVIIGIPILVQFGIIKVDGRSGGGINLFEGLLGGGGGGQTTPPPQQPTNSTQSENIDDHREEDHPLLPIPQLPQIMPPSS